MTHEQPHDKLIKETLSFLPEAKRFFQHFLPAHVSDNLNFDTLRLENTTFVNQQAREFYSDLVFSCEWKKGGTALLQLLVEHKSAQEKRPHLQLGGYVAEGYLYQAKQQQLEKKDEPLAVIVPVLLYHGTEKWKVQGYEDYFELPDPEIRRYLPAFEFILVDLSKYTDEEIMALGVCFLVTTLLLFKHKNDKEFVLNNSAKIFIFVHATMNPEDVFRFFKAIVLYLFKAFRFEKPDMERIIHVMPKISEPMFESTYDMLIKEGMIQGEAIGFPKGQALGERKSALTSVINCLVTIPLLGDVEVASITGMPETFVRVFRAHFLKGDIRLACKVAVGVFSDLELFSDVEAKKVKSLVKSAIQKQHGKS